MKNIVYIILLGFIAISCKKEDENTKTTATALKNGKAWIAKSSVRRAIDNDLFVFEFDVFNSNNERRQSLYFLNIGMQLGIFSLTPFREHISNQIPICGFSTLSSDGDVLDQIYRVIENTSTIEILSISSDNKRITGKFDVTLERDTSNQNPNNAHPDILTFKDGFFTVYLD